MNLKFYIKDKKKIYTLKESINNKKTEEAHYKFLKFKECQDPPIKQ
jgi:hypothetical protein